MIRKRILATTALLFLSASVFAQNSDKLARFEGAAQDAWISGKIEMAFTLNEHLNPFSIDTDVDAGIVTLTGMVDSKIESDLAEEIAKGVDGVVAINNELKPGMKPESSTDASDNSRRNFPTWFDDATTTAAVKSKLVRNSSTTGLEIDVDTREDVVTLSGSVKSDEEKQLAEQLARNTGDVKDVRNLLVVDDS
jgi:osmotically-inducible protein OsmY